MINPRIRYNELKRVVVNPTKTYTDIFSDIYIKNTRQKTGIDDTNEEEAVLSKGKFIPGKIYTYSYDPLYKDVLDFYDTRPIVLVNNSFYAPGTGNNILEGINLNFLPTEIRVQTLEKFYYTFKDDIDRSRLAASQGQVNLSISRIMSFFADVAMKLKLFSSAGVGYQFAYRRYIISRINDLRYVEYNHWEYLPFMDSRYTVGKMPEEIHKEYWLRHQILINQRKKRKK